jgi:polyhydroxyalkanoate synthase
VKGPLDSLRALAARFARGLPAALPPVGTTPHDAVLAAGPWRLLRFRPRELTHRIPILLVPSLINRWYVLDLGPQRSFIDDLVASGHDVYIIDWGTPRPEDRYASWDDVCGRWLGRALRHVARRSPDGVAHVLGYCLGGTLAVCHAAAYPEHVATLTALAAPIDFERAGIMSVWTRSPTFDVGALVEAYGNVPWPLMQASFHMIRPTLNLAKAVTLLDRAWDDESLDGFLALETWGNDNVSFPGACYRDYIERLYRGNELLRGTMTVCGRSAALERIDCPTLVVSFEHDAIVPAPSATALLERIGSPDKAHVHLGGGHVGAVVSKKAARGLWPTLRRFWAERDDLKALGLAPEPAHDESVRSHEMATPV